MRTGYLKKASRRFLQLWNIRDYWTNRLYPIQISPLQHYQIAECMMRSLRTCMSVAGVALQTKTTYSRLSRRWNRLKMNSVSKWRTYCHIFWKDGEPIGLSIPHIEHGTKDEGRLFYFGVVPEWRGQGYGTIIHRMTFGILKKIGAATYVGSTDENNHHMIRIFKANGCHLRDKKGIFRIEKKNSM